MTGTERGNLLDQIRSKILVDKYDLELVRREIADGLATVNGRKVTEPGLIIHAEDRISIPFRPWMIRCATYIGENGKAWQVQ